MGLTQRQKILGLPIGPKQFSWSRLLAWIAAAGAALAALLIGRDVVQHSA